MKIFTSHLDADKYYIEFIFVFSIVMASLGGYLFQNGLINIFNLVSNPNVLFSSLNNTECFEVIATIICEIPFLIFSLFGIVNIVCISCLKIYVQKTHPIYQFIKNKTIANKVYHDAAYLFKSYCQLNQSNNAKRLMLNSLDDSNSLLLQQLDEQIYNTLQQYSGNSDFDLSNFPIYQELFIAVVAPLEIRQLNHKLNKIEKYFAYGENKLSPKQFLDMIEKLKQMMNVHFKHNEYHDYKQWHILAHHKIYSVVDKK